MTNAVLTDAFGHHGWATLALLDACGGLTAEQLAQPMPGAYGSILDTMRHIVGADGGYLALLTDGRVEPIDEETLDLDGLRLAAIGYGDAWAAYVDRDFPAETIVTRHRDDGSESRAPLTIRVAQALQHGTDHRSQVCTALTLRGIEPPEIDVWAFGVQAGRLSVTEPTT